MANRLKGIRVRKNKEGKRQYRHIRYPNIPPSISDLYVTTRDGDRLDLIAHTFYNDKGLWWAIAQANPDVIKGDGVYLKPGITIRIPNAPEMIIANFDKLNKKGR